MSLNATPKTVGVADAGNEEEARLPEPIYFVSYDNPRAGDYRRPLRELGKVGQVERMVPKTTLRLNRRWACRFADVKAAVERSIDPRRGSAVLFSSKTGRAYTLDNRGNRRGEWVRRDVD